MFIAFAIAALFFYRTSSIGEGYGRIKVKAYQVTEGWGYRIYDDTTLIIEQPVIPGIPGTAGFKTRQDALKTGELVQQKLSRGIFPPTITAEELDSLGTRP
ncbi:DUF4907 domain-containing protein [Dyadobacter sandarakinus]|uniref:DUF4907 domain-containing protein n=1 Tax=Dyadobacter sandarakinus TaxID=2747268 RepID=UPI001E479911|nr:DUF4907 domain-containing protein [Dyadobacter sandarakinus]